MSPPRGTLGHTNTAWHKRGLTPCPSPGTPSTRLLSRISATLCPVAPMHFSLAELTCFDQQQPQPHGCMARLHLETLAAAEAVCPLMRSCAGVTLLLLLLLLQHQGPAAVWGWLHHTAAGGAAAGGAGQPSGAEGHWPQSCRAGHGSRGRQEQESCIE